MKNKKIIEKFFLFIACFIASGSLFAIGKSAKPNELERELESVIAPYMATVGIAVMNLETKEITTVNDNHCYPMQSVYKFPLALYVLKDQDHPTSLDDVFSIDKKKLDQHTWSPIVDSFPDQDVELTLSDLLRYMISKSDNNACDFLFENADGVRAVNRYVHNTGVTNMAISATEREMHANWQAQYTNWCQPSAMMQLLCLFYERKLLPGWSTDFLMKLMTESQNSDNRIKGLLPPGTVVAHKTGSSGTNDKGITAATNDVGIITLPNGHHLALVVYVSDYKGDTGLGEHIIATVAKCIWDYYTIPKMNTK